MQTWMRDCPSMSHIAFRDRPRLRSIKRAQQARIIAIGTTVVRALEHAAAFDGVIRAGEALATQRIDGASELRVVNALLSGTHEPGTSHHELLRAFINPETLSRVDRELDTENYRTHEFGDSIFVERASLKTERAAHLPRVCGASTTSTRRPLSLETPTTRNSSGSAPVLSNECTSFR